MKLKVTRQEYLEIQSDLAESFVEDVVSEPWGEGVVLGEDPRGCYTYTDEAQEMFNAAFDGIEAILDQYLDRGE